MWFLVCGVGQAAEVLENRLSESSFNCPEEEQERIQVVKGMDSTLMFKEGSEVARNGAFRVFHISLWQKSGWGSYRAFEY